MKETRMPPAWSANLVANSGNTIYGVSVIVYICTYNICVYDNYVQEWLHVINKWSFSLVFIYDIISDWIPWPQYKMAIRSQTTYVFTHFLNSNKNFI